MIKTKLFSSLVVKGSVKVFTPFMWCEGRDRDLHRNIGESGRWRSRVSVGPFYSSEDGEGNTNGFFQSYHGDLLLGIQVL